MTSLCQSAFHIDFFEADIHIPETQLQVPFPFCPPPEHPREFAPRLHIRFNPLLPVQHDSKHTVTQTLTPTSLPSVNLWLYLPSGGFLLTLDNSTPNKSSHTYLHLKVQVNSEEHTVCLTIGFVKKEKPTIAVQTLLVQLDLLAASMCARTSTAQFFG